MISSTEKNAELERPSGFQQDFDIIRQIPLFLGLEPDCLKLLAVISRRVELMEGDHLMVQGEDDGSACCLITGRLQGLYRLNGRDFPIREFLPGQFLGGLALLGKAIRLLTVRATARSKVLRLSRDGFQKVMQQHPGSMTRVAANLCAGVSGWEEELLSGSDASGLQDRARVLGISLL